MKTKISLRSLCAAALATAALSAFRQRFVAGARRQRTHDEIGRHHRQCLAGDRRGDQARGDRSHARTARAGAEVLEGYRSARPVMAISPSPMPTASARTSGARSPRWSSSLQALTYPEHQEDHLHARRAATPPRRFPTCAPLSPRKSTSSSSSPMRARPCCRPSRRRAKPASSSSSTTAPMSAAKPARTI